MVVGEKRTANIMDGIENTGDVRLHDHRLRLKQRFDIVRKLGQGTYGKVQLGINKKTGQEVAIKTIKKCKIESEADLIRIRREVQIMSSVRHPNIVHIYEVFENSEKMILVMEYCSGGELYDYLSQKKVLQEDEARRLFRQIATAVYYCHIHKICHRDLKLENVLLDDTGSAKIADFGLSNVFKETSLLSTFCGSPLYASPEIVKGTPYIGPEVDCWSLGVLLYTLVYGAMPFDGSNFKRLVRQISNGDYYEPKNPSSASPLIRDMLTVDPLKRADIAYICDHSWVNMGCETSCLEMAEALAAETPVRLDLLLSLAPAAPSNSNSVVVPAESQLGPEESNTDLTSSASMAVEPSNSAEKRILELVAEGGEDAIKPSPTRTIVSAGENKRKLELAMSASGLQRKKERVASAACIAAPTPALEEEPAADLPTDQTTQEQTSPPTLKSSATIIIQPSPPAVPQPAPAPAELVKDPTKEIKETPKESPKEDDLKEKTGAKPRIIVKKKITPKTSEEKASPEKEEPKQEEAPKPSSVASAADKLTSLSLSQQAPVNQTPAKPKKLSFPGGNVGSFKEQFERRASLTTTPEVKKNFSKPVSKIAKPKAQSEDRELSTKMPDSGSVRLQQIGIEPSPTPPDEHPNRGSVKKTESEPSHGSTPTDPAALLQDARRSLQNSMAKLVEEKNSEETRRRAARDIITSAIRTGKPPVPYGRSSSAGVTSLVSPPGTPPAVPAPRVFRTEAQHRVEDHRNRGVSVERIIPINLAGDDVPTSPPPPPKAGPSVPAPKSAHQPLRRLVSNESSTSEACPSPSGEPIKKSAREFIIPIAVEGKGYVTPRQRSLEPDTSSATRLTRTPKPRRISSLVSGGESEEEDEMHMHRLRSTRAARAESVSSGEEDEEDEGFHLLTAENLFSTLLHRVRALTNRLNGEEGPGFQNTHSLFNNLHQSPFFNRREGWGSRDLHADFESMFSKPRSSLPRGSSKKSKHQTKTQQNAEKNTESGLDLSDLDLSSIQLSEAEVRALSGLTPALSRRLQQQLLASLPPAAAKSLRRTLSLHDPAANTATSTPQARSRSASKAAASEPTTPPTNAPLTDTTPTQPEPSTEQATQTEDKPTDLKEHVPLSKTNDPLGEEMELPASQFCTLPRLKRHTTRSRETTPPVASVGDYTDYATKISSLPKEQSHSRGSSIRSTPDRPLLSKYLTPERNLSLDESYSSDSGSILSEPSYIAAYGAPSVGNVGLGFRRHSMRLTGDQPRKRISRFLRSDFFDSSPDESIYAKHKKEKELETQKILKEIRQKRNKSLETDQKNSTEKCEGSSTFKEDFAYPRKCLSPILPISTILTGKERSRSNTPFFPILDNIKENTIDPSLTTTSSRYGKLDDSKQSLNEESSISKESKLSRPKSYPVKNVESFDKSNDTDIVKCNNSGKDNESKEKTLTRESKLLRPKSYPTSSPSPEKVFINRNVNKIDVKGDTSQTDSTRELKSDVEVSFSITLPKKTLKPKETKPDLSIRNEATEKNGDSKLEGKKPENNLTLKRYQVLKINNAESETSTKEHKNENETTITNSTLTDTPNKETINEDEKRQVINHAAIKEEVVLKPPDPESSDKKGTIKKKIIKKVSSKSKTDTGSTIDGNGEGKPVTEKKKITKKLKEKTTDEGNKPTNVTKKKSVLQSIGHKLEKFASTNKSSSPDKVSESNVVSKELKNANDKLSRMQREQSVPVSADPHTESNLIQRAVTLTDVAALDSPSTNPSKTTVSRVLGLFKKFEPKEKVPKSVEKPQSDNLEAVSESNGKVETSDGPSDNFDTEKPKRPTSLLLNGLGRKKYGRTASDSISTTSIDNDNQTTSKKDNNSKNLRNSLKLDFSRLPRVKKIVPTNPVIVPQMMNTDNKDLETNGILSDNKLDVSNDNQDSQSRSRSRSRSTYSDLKSDNSADAKYADKNPLSPTESTVHHPFRNHEPTTPEKEDVVERIRRKSFYSRFNEKKQRRKSNLVGPGATEYDPLARIHGQPSDTKFDMSPTSPVTYDISPGYSIGSDVSPSTERYRSLMSDLPVSTRSNLRFDNYGLNDKIDTYRSLDRNDFRKYPGTRSYLDYDQPSSYASHRYTRTKSLLDSSDCTEDLSSLRDPHKYNRTISMYSPGSYATYRPKRTLNSAIILKESEKEPSPENILEKIRNRKKYSISVTRKPDSEKDSLPRSDGASKSESNGAECSEKVN